MLLSRNLEDASAPARVIVTTDALNCPRGSASTLGSPITLIRRAKFAFARTRIFRGHGPRRGILHRHHPRVFQEHLLPQGQLTFPGRSVNPAAIRRMGLMTVEGEKDDICSIGQTLAAQELCTGARAYRRVHHIQASVGHYTCSAAGANEIYPLLRDIVHVNS